MTIVADPTSAAELTITEPDSTAPETEQLTQYPAERPMRQASPGPITRTTTFLFRSSAMAPVWLVVRLWLGYEWLAAGWEKLHATGQASWFGHAPALQGFVHGADAVWANRAHAFGHPNVHYAWFVNYLHFVGDHGAIFGPIVVFSELLIGLGLITGTLTRWAALGGIALNVMYICGGSAGVNGVFILVGVLLMAAWRVAGELGGDGILRRLLAPRLASTR